LPQLRPLKKAVSAALSGNERSMGIGAAPSRRSASLIASSGPNAHTQEPDHVFGANWIRSAACSALMSKFRRSSLKSPPCGDSTIASIPADRALSTVLPPRHRRPELCQHMKVRRLWFCTRCRQHRVDLTSMVGLVIEELNGTERLWLLDPS
jgi:hypothetical protein